MEAIRTSDDIEIIENEKSSSYGGSCRQRPYDSRYQEFKYMGSTKEFNRLVTEERNERTIDSDLVEDIWFKNPKVGLLSRFSRGEGDSSNRPGSQPHNRALAC